MKRIGWINGWAVPEAWFRQKVQAALPGVEHVVVAARSDALDRLEVGGPYDWVVGYSLGSLLLLGEVERASRLGRVALLAPIFAFPREANAGGRVARAQVRQLARWVQRDALAALADFFALAGLDVTAERQSAVELDGLLWGLERLVQDRVEPRLPAGWSAWCGSVDPLLDAARLKELVPPLSVVPGAGHHPAALLRVFAEEVL